MEHHELTPTFMSKAGRAPRTGEIFFDNDMLHVYRGVHPTGRWEELGPPKDPGFQGIGRLQFELLEGILIEGSPAWVIQMVLRALYGFQPDKANDFADLLFRIFKECGWKIPTETDNEAVPGFLTVIRPDTSQEFQVEDIRPILSQLQSPELNGFISVEQGAKTSFISLGGILGLEVSRENKETEVP
jgi:hypothetical protein